MLSPDALDNLSALDPEAAIANRDVAQLQRCLEAGWNPVVLQSVSVNRRDPLMDRVIYRGWLEGWCLLRQYHPELSRNLHLITLAFKRLQAPILADMFDQGGWTLDTQLEDHKTPYLVAIDSLGGPFETLSGEEHADVPFEQRAVDTFSLLCAKGADPYAVYPGPFHEQNTSCPGHSAWTRALYCMRWLLALRLMPTTVEDVVRQPRWQMAVGQLAEEAVSPHQHAPQMTRLVYAQWLKRFAAWWFRQPGVRPPHDRTEWPLLMTLDPELRRVVWDAWDRPGEQEVNAYHDVALLAASHEVLPLLDCILSDRDNQDPAGWRSPSAEGVRPCDLWALVLGQEPTAEGLTLRGAMAMTRAHLGLPPASR